MNRSPGSLLLPVLLAAGLALPAGASAARPADDGPAPPAPGVKDPNRVHKLKPWQARFKYRVSRDAAVRAELNGRADTIAQVVKDQWWQIDCQRVSTTQNGPVLWNRIPNVGWVPDSAMQTFDDDRLQGSPTCPDPAPGHVWFKQGWAPGKQYRLTRDVQLQDRPNGAPIAVRLPAKSWTPLGCAVSSRGAAWYRVNPAGPTAGYLPAAAVNTWQPGVPAGIKRCAGAPAPVRTYAAIGDSYASGIGTDAGEDTGCRRSPTSYFGLLRGSLKQGITTSDDRFQACSGDTSEDIRENQLDALDRTTRVVTLSAGGNDFGFTKVLQACATYDVMDGKGCDDAVDEYVSDSDVTRVGKDLRTLYAAVRRAAPNAQVYVLGYPELIDPDDVDGCYSIGDDDGELLHETAQTVNRTIRRAVGKRRGYRFVGLVEAFRDHPACKDGGTPWINGIVSRDPPERDESFHPNDAGHQGIAAVLRRVAPQYFR